MILDSQLLFSDAQAVTSTAISTNVIDLNHVVGPNAIQDIGSGEDMYLVVTTLTAATDTSSDATLTVTLESSAVVGLTSATTHFSTGALAFAAFSPAGTNLAIIKLPVAEYLRYLGVRYTVASGPLTAGTFDAYLTKDISKFKAYANGFYVG